MLHVGEEALARLFAVVSDVDAGGELLRDDVTRRGLDSGGQSHLVHRFASARADEELDQRRRARQAAGVGRQDAMVAALHAGPSRPPPLHKLAATG